MFGSISMTTSASRRLTGDVRVHTRFGSRILNNHREVLVYLPPGYEQSGARYPVLYLHDGQNVFDASTAFAGVEWGADDTAERLIHAGQIAPLIIVAVANAGMDRIHEYAPTRGLIGEPAAGRRPQRSRGLARKYGRFLLGELKPFIDANYRTMPEGIFTGLGGSSLGGLVTLALGLWFPRAFTRLAVMSPSVWWDDCTICRLVAATKRRPALKIWLDTGTAEPGWERTRELRDALVQRGWTEGDDLHYLEAAGAGHDEGAWAARMEPMLRWLFPVQENAG